MAQTGVLLYCITNAFNEEFTMLKGLDGESNLFGVEEAGLYGVASYVSLDEYGEESIQSKGEDLSWLTEKASKFMDIIININSRTLVIPMKFLTIFNSEDRIRETIRENVEKFKGNFGRLVGKDELSLKIYCNEEIFKKTSMEEEIRKFEESIIGKPKGSAFFLRKKFYNELGDRAQEKICYLSNFMIKEASSYYSEMKSNKLLAKEFTGVTDKMILNCAFLVETEKKQDFERYIHNLREKYKECGFAFQLTGPWPPYNFCEL